MTRKVGFFLGAWIASLFITWNPVQAISPDVQPAPLVRLTGVLEAVENPPPSAFPDLRVWFGDKSRMFHVVKAEPVMPAYRIREQLRKAPSLGLRLVAEGDALAQLESADANHRPITIEGWLRPHAGLLRVKAIQATPGEQERVGDSSP